MERHSLELLKELSNIKDYSYNLAKIKQVVERGEYTTKNGIIWSVLCENKDNLYNINVVTASSETQDKIQISENRPNFFSKLLFKSETTIFDVHSFSLGLNDTRNNIHSVIHFKSIPIGRTEI